MLGLKLKTNKIDIFKFRFDFKQIFDMFFSVKSSWISYFYNKFSHFWQFFLYLYYFCIICGRFLFFSTISWKVLSILYTSPDTRYTPYARACKLQRVYWLNGFLSAQIFLSLWLTKAIYMKTYGVCVFLLRSENLYFLSVTRRNYLTFFRYSLFLAHSSG